MATSAAGMMAQIETGSDRLLEAMRNRTPCDPIRSLIEPGGLDAAYAVQSRTIGILLAEGRHIVGRKIGLTSPAVQKQLGVDQPDYGTLLDDMAFLDGQEISLGRLIQPKVEAEVAFVLEHDLEAAEPSAAQAAQAVAYAVAAIEIVDSRIRDWKISIFDTIADNASSGAFVLGTERRKLGDIDLVGCRMTMEGDGAVLSSGTGADCLGSPLISLAWLAGRMTALGTPLRAGQVVLSGALGPMVTVKAGTCYTARISGLGSVVAAFGMIVSVNVVEFAV